MLHGLQVVGRSGSSGEKLSLLLGGEDTVYLRYPPVVMKWQYPVPPSAWNVLEQSYFVGGYVTEIYIQSSA